MGSRGGVELRPTSIRVHFTYAGKARKETVYVSGKPLAPTPANEKYAQRLINEVRQKIKHGVFEYADYFPESETAKKLAGSGAAGTTLDQLGKDWLAAMGQRKASTLDQYATAVRFWCSLLGGNTLVANITGKLLKAKIGKYAWPSAKTHNNYMIALRGMFDLEFPEGKRPTDGIKNMRATKKKPDPLTIEERDKILERMRKQYDPRVWAYFTWMFYTGMRPEEAIALKWGDVDFNLRQVLIQRVRTFRGSEWNDTKTYTERIVDLVPQAMAALQVMKPFTMMKRDEEAGEPVDIFENPNTKRPWLDERSQRDHYWKPTLRALGIRDRRAYATRHTYCTVALMGGVKPAYIAHQAGHSLKMLLEVYALWIPANDKGAERRAMEAAMGNTPPAEISPALPQVSEA